MSCTVHAVGISYLYAYRYIDLTRCSWHIFNVRIEHKRSSYYPYIYYQCIITELVIINNNMYEYVSAIDRCVMRLAF